MNAVMIHLTYEDRSINDIQKMYNEKQLDMLLEKKIKMIKRKLFIKYHLTGRIGLLKYMNILMIYII